MTFIDETHFWESPFSGRGFLVVGFFFPSLNPCPHLPCFDHGNFQDLQPGKSSQEPQREGEGSDRSSFLEARIRRKGSQKSIKIIDIGDLV